MARSSLNHATRASAESLAEIPAIPSNTFTDAVLETYSFLLVQHPPQVRVDEWFFRR